MVQPRSIQRIISRINDRCQLYLAKGNAVDIMLKGQRVFVAGSVLLLGATFVAALLATSPRYLGVLWLGSLIFLYLGLGPQVRHPSVLAVVILFPGIIIGAMILEIDLRMAGRVHYPPRTD